MSKVLSSAANRTALRRNAKHATGRLLSRVAVGIVVLPRRRWGLTGMMLLSVPIVLASAPTAARADTTLTVDLSTTIRPVTHAASGSLYGVTEKLPADVSGLITPLHPFVFNNPAADVQQPVGDAIVVAGRVAPAGAKVSIRLADLFAGWPYKFTSVSDWLDKVGQVVTRKQASGLTNYYGYEIWNEPNGTWTSQISFNSVWQQTYAKLRQLDPDAKIIGPSISYYDANNLKSFLTFAKANNCVPDIISWHELSGGNLTSNFQNYRALEQQLGVGPLPISINEYSGKNDLTVEGQPGASAPMIAKFERFKIDSACISYWDVSHPGRLGSLLATATAPNGGWWFYKWYGDMTGNMVGTTPPTPNDAAALDGFANLDSTTKTASVVLGGVNDGTIRVVVKGFGVSALAGSKVHTVVEHTPFINRTTAVTATETISTTDLSVSGDQITVSISNANGSDGYRVSLSAVGGQTAGGGAGGTGGTGSGGGANEGAAAGSSGGGQVSGGNQGAAGSATSEGGASAAGTSSQVGAAGLGGSLASAGGALAGGSGGPGVAPSSSDNGSCSCSAVGRASLPVGWFAAMAGLTLSLLRRRRRAGARQLG